MHGSRNGDEDRQECERCPGDHVINLADTGRVDDIFADNQSKDDQSTLQETCACQDVDERCNRSGHDRDQSVKKTYLGLRSILRECHDLAELFIDILGVHTDDDLILTAGLDDLDNAGLLLDFLSNFITGLFFQDQTQTSRAVSSAENIRLTNQVFDIRG